MKIMHLFNIQYLKKKGRYTLFLYFLGERKVGIAARELEKGSNFFYIS